MRQTPQDSELASSFETEGEGGLSIDWMNLVFRYRWWLCAGVVLGLGLGIAAYMKLGPEYMAIGQVMVSRRNAVPLKEQSAMGDWGERSEHIALIMSPMIASEAVRLGKLDKLKTFAGESDPTQMVLDDLKVKRVAGQDRSYLNVLDVTFQSASADDARHVVKAVIDAYASYLNESRSEKTTEVFKTAQEAHDTLQKSLREKEEAYLKFRESAPLQWRAPIGAIAADGTSGATNVHQERVIAVEEQRRLNLLRRTEINSRIQALQKAQEQGESTSTMEMLIRRFIANDGSGAELQQQQQEISAFENRLLPLILEEEKLLRDFGPDHPEVKAVRKSIDTTLDFYRKHGLRMPDDMTPGPDGKPLIKERANLVQNFMETLRQQLKELDIREQQLNVLFELESNKAKEYARFQAEDQAMTAELNRLRSLWGQLVDRMSQLTIDKESSGYTLRQTGPIKDEWVLKRLLKIVGAGMVAGMGLIISLIVLKEFLSNQVRTVREVRQLLPEAYLGAVTSFDPEQSHLDPVQNVHPSLRYLRSPASIEAENYRTIRTSLLVTAEALNAQVIQVGSPEPGDGKTTLVSNLALALASSGKRVLLIDADLRRPMATRLFGLRPDPGLVDVLQGEIALENAIVETVVEGLMILPSGRPPHNPAELLEGGLLRQLIAKARTLADIVLMDAPPVLAVSDACIIGQHVDGYLLTVRLGKNRRPMLRRSRDLLLAHHIPILGVVANGVEPCDREEMGYYADYNRKEAYFPQDQASVEKPSIHRDLTISASPVRQP